MKEFKGTPGPWFFDEDSECVVSNSAECCVLELLVTGDTTAGEDSSNIKLIAAAPELLEALQNMIGAFDNPIVRRKLPGDFNKEAIESARAAIAKALGA